MNLIKIARDRILLLRCAWVVGWTSFNILLKIHWVKKPRELINQYTRRSSEKILKILKATSEVQMTEPLHLTQHDHAIFMSNHQSLIDLPLIFASLPGTIRVVIKKELTKIPLFGKALVKSECITIDRHNPNNAVNFFSIAKEKIKSGLWLWIFPEGTRSRSGELLPLKNGAIRLAREIGAKIIPVAIIGTNKILPAGTFNVDLNQKIKLRIGKPIDTTSYSTLDTQKSLLLRVQSAIAELMNEKGEVTE